MAQPLRIIGLDPGLRHTGWGVITLQDGRLKPVAAGVITVPEKQTLAERLKQLHLELMDVLAQFTPDEAAVEETFSNTNPKSTLKLGMARGVVMAAPALHGIAVHEYAANAVKKAVVGAGHAAKEQMQMMIRTLLPTLPVDSADASDALGVAICHAHHVPMLQLAQRVTA